MKKLLALLFLLAPMAVLAADDDHLVPEDSVFSRGMPPPPYFSFDDGTGYDSHDYYKSVLSVLNAAYERDIVARLIVIPSFQNEYAIALSREDDAWKIIYLRPEIHIWKFKSLEQFKSDAVRARSLDGESRNAEIIEELEAELPETIEDVAVETCALEIDDALGRALYTLWSEMLFRTRHVDRRPVTPEGDETVRIGADGITYHYSFDYGIGALAGKVWSPDEKSITGKFVAIGKMMRDACESQNTGLFAEMRYDVEQLLAELAKSKY